MILHRDTQIIRLRGRIIFLFLIFASGIALSQQYYFDNYSVSEGLAQSTVYSIIQDTEDNFWMGTKAGVSRYDGKEFRNFTAENGMAEGGVRAVFEDAFGNIWMGHDGGGISRFDGNRFEVFADAGIHLKSNITSILEDEDGNIWVSSQESGAMTISNPGAEIKSIKYEMYLGRRLADRIFGSFLSDDGSLYFVTDPVVKRFNKDSLNFENLVLNGIPKFFATTSILIDSKENFWFGTYHGGLFRYEPEKDDTRMYDLIKLGMTSNWVSALYEDRYGDVWVGTWGGGVARIDKEDNFTVFDLRNGMPGSKIWQIMEDEEGNLIIATNEHGFCVFKGDYFVSYFEGDGLINSQVFAIEQTLDDKFWIGTNQGISIIEEKKGKSVVTDYERLQGERIKYITEDQNGSIWIGAEGQGLFTLHSNGDFRFEPRINSNVKLNIITGLAVDPDNNLWVGTLDGLLYYEIDNRRIDRLTQVSGLSGNEISSVFAD
nr:hypothetical protein [Bacteroidales bacterium]